MHDILFESPKKAPIEFDQKKSVTSPLGVLLIRQSTLKSLHKMQINLNASPQE